MSLLRQRREGRNSEDADCVGIPADLSRLHRFHVLRAGERMTHETAKRVREAREWLQEIAKLSDVYVDRDHALTLLALLDAEQPAPLPPPDRGGVPEVLTATNHKTIGADSAAAAQAGAPAQKEQWRPIETAPKDGATVILSNNTGVMLFGYWWARSTGGQWVEAGHETFSIDATWWMPKPPRPSTTREQPPEPARPSSAPTCRCSASFDDPGAARTEGCPVHGAKT